MTQAQARTQALAQTQAQAWTQAQAQTQTRTLAQTQAQTQARVIPTFSLAEAAAAAVKKNLQLLFCLTSSENKNKNNLANLQAGYLIQNLRFQIVMQNMSQG